MKKITKVLGVIIASFIIINSTNASFIYEKIDPVCGINGETFTSTSAGKSDTSSWKILVAYSGKCIETPKLSQNVKEKIYKISSDFFSKYAKYDSRTNIGIVPNAGGIDLNLKGKNFVKNNLFPKIKVIISNEIKKEKPNLRKISVLNYLVKTIGYDYYISMPK